MIIARNGIHIPLTTQIYAIGIAADHAGAALRDLIVARLQDSGHHIISLGGHQGPEDDYPDAIAPLARAVSTGEVWRGIAVCGSGVGACIAANKIPGVRAATIQDGFSAHQGVEDDDMNLICLGGRILGAGLAMELVHIFLSANFSGAERHRRRLAKIAALECGSIGSGAV